MNFKPDPKKEQPVQPSDSVKSCDEPSAASDALRNAPQSFLSAFDQFRKAQSSYSTDARMEAGAALARLAHEATWIVPILKDACIAEPDEGVRSKHIFTLASIGTKEAVSALVQILESELKREQPTFALNVTCQALCLLASKASHELENIERLLPLSRKYPQKAPPEHKETLSSMAFDSLLRTIRAIRDRMA
jgi:HEAT repeat protein